MVLPSHFPPLAEGGACTFRAGASFLVVPRGAQQFLFTGKAEHGMVKGKEGCKMNENEMAQVLALMNQYARILTELNDRHVVRTYNSPVGDFGEWLVAQKLGLTLERNSAKGLDAIGPDGLRYQIKCRWERSDHPTVSSRELGVIRNLDENQFDYLIVVIFDRSFCIKEAYSIPHDIIQHYALYRRHVNGHILLANGPVLEDAAVENITHRLR